MTSWKRASVVAWMAAGVVLTLCLPAGQATAQSRAKSIQSGG